MPDTSVSSQSYLISPLEKNKNYILVSIYKWLSFFLEFPLHTPALKHVDTSLDIISSGKIFFTHLSSDKYSSYIYLLQTIFLYKSSRGSSSVNPEPIMAYSRSDSRLNAPSCLEGLRYLFL